MKFSKQKQIAIFAILFLILPLVLSQAPDQQQNNNSNASSALDRENIEDTINRAKDTIDTIRDKESREEYLKRAWTGVLNNTKAGQALQKVDRGLTFLNPAFKIILGIEFTLSWLFVLALIMWIALLKVGYNYLSGLLTLYLKKSLKRAFKWIQLAIFIGWIVLISSPIIPTFLAIGTQQTTTFGRMPLLMTNQIINLVTILPSNSINQIILFIIAIALIVFMIRFSAIFKKKVKKELQQESIEEAKKEVKNQKKIIERIEAKKEEEEEEDEIKKQAKRNIENLDTEL